MPIANATNETVTQTAQAVTNSANPILSFILSPTGLIIIGVVIVLYLFYKSKKAPDVFKGVELEKVLRDRFEGQLKIIDETNIRFGTLRRGESTIGRIKRHGIITFENASPVMPWEKRKKKTPDIKPDTTPDMDMKEFTKLHIFEIATGRGIMSAIQEILRMNLLILVIPDPFVRRFSNEFFNNPVDYFSIPQDIDVVSFGEVFFYGFDCFKYIKGQAWLYGREKELEELINLPKRTVYLDTHHAKHTEELEKIYALDEKRRKGYLDSMIPGGRKND